MIGLIEIPGNQDDSLTMLFFTKEEDAQNYVKLYNEKYPNDGLKFKTVKIQKHMIFDAGADEEDCYYKFDPKLEDMEEDVEEDDSTTLQFN
jgi:hypothetical protein